MLSISFYGRLFLSYFRWLRVQEPARDFRRQLLAGFFGRLGEMDVLDDQPGI